MINVLILIEDGEFVEKNIPEADLDDLQIDSHVSNIGIGKPSELLKIPYLDKNMTFVGWSQGNQENIHNIQLNFKNIIFYGDILCFMSDNKNNYSDINKSLYVNDFTPYIISKFNKYSKIPKESDSDSDLEEYEDNLKIENNKNNEFNLGDYIKDNFI